MNRKSGWNYLTTGKSIDLVLTRVSSLDVSLNYHIFYSHEALFILGSAASAWEYDGRKKYILKNDACLY